MRTRTVCGVSRGDAPLSLRWLKDGEPLPLSLAVNISSLDQYSSLLSIPSLFASHSGDYTCVATNPANEVKFTASLQVKGKVLMFSSLLFFKKFFRILFCISLCVRLVPLKKKLNKINASCVYTNYVCPLPVALARSGFAAVFTR
jgi:Immunoglobulin I-set domain